MLQDRTIRASKSPYNSSICIVPKKPNFACEKPYWLVVNYKRLNVVTIVDAYPIPDITKTLTSFKKSKLFTTIDLTSGFHQIKMKESDIPKTPFSTSNGKY